MDNKEKAKEFLANINKDDKVALVFHDDLDGFASGILLYDYCKIRESDVKTFPSFLSEDLFLKLTPKLNEFNKIIIADIAPFYISNNLEKLSDKKILYIDHHQKSNEISQFILEYRAPQDKYFPASRMVFDLIGGKEWLGVGGTIADVGYKYEENKNFIYGFLEKNKISLEDFEKKVAYPITDFLIYFCGDLNSAFEILKNVDTWENLEEVNKYAEEVEKEIQFFLEDFEKNKEVINDMWLYYFEPKFKIKSIIATHNALKFQDKVLITITPNKNIKDKLDISGRCQSGEVEIPSLLKFAIQGLDNASCGGHLRAAGGFIMKQDLAQFKENLRNYKL
jgi:single-stranded DNA-specific DHH superfamily exonuclease